MLTKTLVILLFCFATVNVASQSSGLKVDTVQRGYYIMPDTSWNSFVVTIYLNGVAVDEMVSGNKLPAGKILCIIAADTGTRVTYHKAINGVADVYNSPPSREYIIGRKNSVTDVVDGRTDTIRITASDLAEIHLDTSVTAFAVSVPINGMSKVFGCAGNTIAQEHKAFIRSLQPGQKVFFQMLLVRNADGSTYRIPQMNYVIVE
jgi:hypothetical protein